jgi:hypothetical protein
MSNLIINKFLKYGVTHMPASATKLGLLLSCTVKLQGL